MFEKVIIDKNDEDENSAEVLRKWWFWYLLSFSPWSSHLSGPSISVTSTLSFSVVLAAPWAVMAHLCLQPYLFHRCTPVFVTSLLSHGSIWMSYRYLISTSWKLSSVFSPQDPFCLDPSCTTVYPVAPTSNLVLAHFFSLSILESSTANQ